MINKLIRQDLAVPRLLYLPDLNNTRPGLPAYPPDAVVVDYGS